MSRHSPRPLTVALDGLTETLAPATTLARVQGIWERVAGPAIAAAARPTAEREGTLTVTCEAAVWAEELTLMQDDLLGRLNDALGSHVLDSLRCRTG